MKHDRDEPVRAFGARWRGQASVCKFTQQCPGCKANTEAMVKSPGRQRDSDGFAGAQEPGHDVGAGP